MNTLTITINRDNDAFQDGYMDQETRRILNHIAYRLSVGKVTGSAIDINGNSVGSFEVEDTND